MSIVFRHVGFEWPNGNVVFDNLGLALNQKVYSLVGPNGVGKTTLARLISSELAATSGEVVNNESVFYFRQEEDRPRFTIGEYLAEVSEQLNEFVAKFLNGIGFDRNCNELSGGEWTRVRLARVVASSTTFLILDEPTNHLDREGRAAVGEFLKSYRGGVLIISHDRELLEKSKMVLELSSSGISVFDGTWGEYMNFKDSERSHLRNQLDVAKRNRDESLRERQEKLDRQAKRQRRGQKAAEAGGMPKILLGARKRRAQITRAKIDTATSEDVNKAVSQAWDAYQELKIDPVMYARLPRVELPQGKTVIEAEELNFKFNTSDKNLWKRDLTFAFRGPERIAITGSNGSGKSTLLKLLKNESLPGVKTGLLRLGHVRSVFLDQDYSQLDPSKSIFENVRESAAMEESELYGLLAMFLFKGERSQQLVCELSGGERLRAALAKAFISTAPANVLFLDEPTNNLDLPNIEFLEGILKKYSGALVVVSHDSNFLANLGMTAEICL